MTWFPDDLRDVKRDWIADLESDNLNATETGETFVGLDDHYRGLTAAMRRDLGADDVQPRRRGRLVSGVRAESRWRRYWNRTL